jgi:hypothetical protein
VDRQMLSIPNRWPASALTSCGHAAPSDLGSNGPRTDSCAAARSNAGSLYAPIYARSHKASVRIGWTKAAGRMTDEAAANSSLG